MRNAGMIGDVAPINSAGCALYQDVPISGDVTQATLSAAMGHYGSATYQNTSNCSVSLQVFDAAASTGAPLLDYAELTTTIGLTQMAPQTFATKGVNIASNRRGIEPMP